MPWRLLLIGVGHLEHSFFIKGPARYLQSYGQLLASLLSGERQEATGDTHGWYVGKAGGKGQQPGEPVRLLLATNSRVWLNLLGDLADRWLHQDLYRLQRLQHLLAQERPQLLGLVIHLGRQHAPGEIAYTVVMPKLLRPEPHEFPVAQRGFDSQTS